MAFVSKKIIVIAVLAGAGYYAYGMLMPQGPGGWGPGGAPPVSVAEVLEKDVQQWHDFSGRLTAVDMVDIKPRVSGTIEQVHLKDGDMVKAGAPLFTIDPRPYQAALDAAKARAALAEADFRRAQALKSDDAIPQSDYDRRKNDADVARAALETARLNLEYTEITAPISGRLSRAEITRGNLVETGSSAPVLTSIVSSDPIYADFEVDEVTYLDYVQSKATHNGKASQIPVGLGLTGEEGFPHQGHISSFDNKLDDQSGTIRVRASFPNPDGALVPGLFARVRIGEPEAAKAVLITDRAVGTDQSNRFVMVVDKDNKVEYRQVMLGALADGLRIVESGLKAGEKIIVSGLQRARPGQEVTPEVVPMDNPSAESEKAAPAADDKTGEKTDKKTDDKAGSKAGDKADDAGDDS